MGFAQQSMDRAQGWGALGGRERRRELRLGGPAVHKLQLSPAHAQLSFHSFALLCCSAPLPAWGARGGPLLPPPLQSSLPF